MGWVSTMSFLFYRFLQDIQSKVSGIVKKSFGQENKLILIWWIDLILEKKSDFGEKHLPIMSSSHVFTNSETTNLGFFSHETEFVYFLLCTVNVNNNTQFR